MDKTCPNFGLYLPKISGEIMQKIKTRKVWGFNPVTRIVRSKKHYNRKKVKQDLRFEGY